MKQSRGLDKSSFVETKSFWLFLALLVALPLLGLFQSSEFSQLVGNVAIQNIAYLQAGQSLEIEVQESSGESIGVDLMTITLADTIKNSQIRVEADSSIPFSRAYYSKFKVSSPDAEKIGKIQFDLKIKETDLLGKGIAIYDLKLFESGKELPTTITKQNGGYVYYTAVASNVGNFVAGKAAPREESKITTAKEVVPEEPVVESAPAVEEPVPVPENIVGEAAGEVQTSSWERFKEFWARFWG